MCARLRLLIWFAVVASSISGCAGKHDHATSMVPTDTTTHQDRQESTLRQPHVRNKMTDTMLAQIVNYYSKEYSSDSVQTVVVRSDTLIELDFQDNGDDTNRYHGTLLVAYISLVTDINPILTGDMNGDGINDMLITVHTEGGGGGGNMWWDDHFLFLTGGNGANKLADEKSDPDIMNGSGYFFPKEISNQAIMGIGNDYAESDGHCCPSLYYRMHVRLIDGQLKTVDRTSLKISSDDAQSLVF